MPEVGDASAAVSPADRSRSCLECTSETMPTSPPRAARRVIVEISTPPPPGKISDLCSESARSSGEHRLAASEQEPRCKRAGARRHGRRLWPLLRTPSATCCATVRPSEALELGIGSPLRAGRSATQLCLARPCRFPGLAGMPQLRQAGRPCRIRVAGKPSSPPRGAACSAPWPWRRMTSESRGWVGFRGRQSHP